MQNAIIPSQTLDTPPMANAIDAEVDVEVLKIVPKQFSIEDEKSANWLVKRIIAAREYAERVKKWADQEQRRADREETTLLFLFGRQIEAWAKGEIEKLNGRRKSICLPGGTVGFRHENPKLVIDDEDTVLQWARHNLSDAIHTVEKLSRSVIKTHFESTGEFPAEGAHVEPAAEKFHIR